MNLSQVQKSFVRSCIVQFGIFMHCAAFCQIPIITDVIPRSAPTGAAIKIIGKNFTAASNGNIVFLGAVKASIISATDTTIDAVVPSGVRYAPISVTTNRTVGYSSFGFSATDTLKTDFLGGSFTMGVDMPDYILTTANLISVDMNNDGKTDIITRSVFTASGGVTIARNTSTLGKLSFGQILDYDIGYYSSQFEVVDINRDGLLDVVATNNNNGSLKTYMNVSDTNTLALAANNIYSSAGSVVGISSGDIDQDGKPDVVTVNNVANTISIFRNTSVAITQTTLAPRIDFATGVSPKSVAVADFDGDGKVDLATCNGSSSISILKNTSVLGSVSLSPVVNMVASLDCKRILAADMDGDGDQDLVVCNGSPKTISIFRNISTINNIQFAAKADWATTSGPTWISINDMNGDGKLDVITSQSGMYLGILRNASDINAISFDTAVAYPATYTPDSHITADFDMDGKIDILCDGIVATFYRNKMKEVPKITSFVPSVAGPGDSVLIIGKNFSGATKIMFGDSTATKFELISDTSVLAIVGTGNDGNVSVVTPIAPSYLSGFSFIAYPEVRAFLPASGPVNSLVTIKGTGFSANVSGNMVSFGTNPAMVVAASNDSLVVVVPRGATQQKISVITNGRIAWSRLNFQLLFEGAGPVFTANYFDTTSVTLPGLSSVKSMAVADFDMDGRQDLAFTATSSGLFFTQKNISAGKTISFGARVGYNAGETPTPLMITDVNNDGKPDLVAGTNSDLYTSKILLNQSVTGSIAFGIYTPSVYQVVAATNVKSADFDSDGRPDMVIKSVYGTQLAVCRNTSTTTAIRFAAAIIVGAAGAVGNTDGEFFIEDFDGDNKPDIALITNTEIAIFRNLGIRGQIAFAAKQSIPMTYVAKTGIAADVDGDGKMDIAIATYNTGIYKIGILKNTGIGNNISFAAPVFLELGFFGRKLMIADLDGDGKPEICASSSQQTNTLSIFKNTSTPGILAFLPKVQYLANTISDIYLCDVDMDGKPDVATSSGSKIYVFRNMIGEPIPMRLCPPIANTSLGSNVSGSAYQWQVDSGAGFQDLSNDANYAGTNTTTLQLKQIPSLWYGYIYRCKVDTMYSSSYMLTTINKWKGSVSNVWENPANWSCGAVPDANTDVVIDAGNILIGSNITIRSLQLKPAVNLNIGAGFSLNVLH